MVIDRSPVLACGAWLKNSACLLDQGRPQWSAPHGDLGEAQACRALEASLCDLAARAQAAGRPVAALAHDLHPDFFSSRIAVALAAEWGLPVLAVQHHHAHIAVVLAEHGIEQPVIGLALDGVGLGSDGTAWGGELLQVGPQNWQRLGQLWPLPLPGGDKAAREPWRMAAAALQELGRGDEIEARFAPRVGAGLARGVQRMLAARLNSPPSSSTGRWFDAAAGALGLSVRQAHEAEAAIALEQLAARHLAARGAVAPLPQGRVDAKGRLDLRPLLARLLGPVEPAEAAAWFHLALAQALADWATDAAQARGLGIVALGGGCFFNALLRERLLELLQARGLRVLQPRSSGCGDAGLALGQAWAAQRRLQSAAASSPSSSIVPLTESGLCV